MGVEKLKKILALHSTIHLDTPVLIYHFEGLKPYTEITAEIFTRIASGVHTIISTISVTELFVKPFLDGNKSAILKLKNQLLNFPNTTYVQPNFLIAVEAARLRALYKLKMPDALVLSTCIVQDSALFITNDKDFSVIKNKEKIEILMLDHFLR